MAQEGHTYSESESHPYFPFLPDDYTDKEENEPPVNNKNKKNHSNSYLSITQTLIYIIKKNQ